MVNQDIIVPQNSEILSIIQKAGYHKLTPVQKKVIPPILEGKDIALETKNSRGKTAAIVLPLIQLIEPGGSSIRGVIITPEPSIVKKVERQFRMFSGKLSSSLKLASVGCEKNIKKELHTVQKPQDVLVGTASRIIDHLRRDNIALTAVQTAVVYHASPRLKKEFIRDIQFIFSKISGKPQMILFSPRITEEDISVLFPRKPTFLSSSPQPGKQEEAAQMNTRDTAVKDAIEAIIKKIKEEEDPDELNNYRKLVRRHVPLVLKSYFSAYLLKQSMGSAPRPAAAGEPATLFVSIGKKRKVFPRDLSRLFLSALELDSGAIGNIKILDNYSFIEVPAAEADRAIKLLNGTEFRGRKLTVNHARKKQS